MIISVCVYSECALTDVPSDVNVLRLLRSPARPGQGNLSERRDWEDSLPELGAKGSFTQINASGGRGQSRLWEGGSAWEWVCSTTGCQAQPLCSPLQQNAGRGHQQATRPRPSHLKLKTFFIPACLIKQQIKCFDCIVLLFFNMK